MGIWEKYKADPRGMRAKRRLAKLPDIESIYVPQKEFPDWKRVLKGAGFGDEEIESVLIPAVVQQGMKDIRRSILDKLEAIATAMTPEEKEAQRDKIRDMLVAGHKAVIKKIE
ncbi:MAG: hypothetical protein Q8P49_00435 [Candidatus Liptonbacteria bacterium]|nr:hypothetical protein [Candidatus Liptonbacteria bacterium]